jgi:hypothetical protein
VLVYAAVTTLQRSPVTVDAVRVRTTVVVMLLSRRCM